MRATVDTALRAATKRLGQANVPNAARDARVVLAHVLGVVPTRLSLMGPELITASAATQFDVLIHRRTTREPVSHLLGTRAFFGRDFYVNRSVLDPRPETECLIEAALALTWTRVLDLGTGSGAILLTVLAERSTATGVGVDAAPEALAVARQNARQLDLWNRVDFRLGDWVQNISERFDLVTCNPPYISENEYARLDPEPRLYEPRMALTPGGDGLACYRQLAPKLGDVVSPGGSVLFEIGASQGSAVTSILRRFGHARSEILCDLDGRDRVVKVQM